LIEDSGVAPRGYACVSTMCWQKPTQRILRTLQSVLTTSLSVTQHTTVFQRHSSVMDNPTAMTPRTNYSVKVSRSLGQGQQRVIAVFVCICLYVFVFLIACICVGGLTV